MKAITVKVLPQTERKPRRIKAFDMDDNNVVMSWTQAEEKALKRHGEASHDSVHRSVALALCEKMGWRGKMACGGIKGALVFVFTE